MKIKVKKDNSRIQNTITDIKIQLNKNPVSEKKESRLNHGETKGWKIHRRV